MYKYSKKAEEKFFNNEQLAFIFAYFAISSDGQDYTRQKLMNKSESAAE